MKNNKLSSMITIKRDFILLNIFFLLMAFIGQAQVITGNNPYCIASSPSYTIVNPPASTTYDAVNWYASTDSGITFSGDPSPKSLSKVVIKSGNIISAPSYIFATFSLGSTVIYTTPNFNFSTPTAPTPPSYVVTKTSDYCTSQYHIITLNVATNPDPSPTTNFSITPRTPDSSIIITQTSKNVFELKLPLNGQPYFLYDISYTTWTSGCMSNSVSATSYSNSVSLNLTNCSNNTPQVNYEITVSPNPYSNGYITIVAPQVTQAATGICRIYNNSGVLVSSFSLTNSSTAYALKTAVGASLVAGMYVVQVTYANGIVKTKNLVVI
ncbi:T9SS type A sorting domain-containing protein [Flavobacterium panacagri]|uniref:T9SS type A sorting domain-containing protein n=1 Tax=Flavobacterium panacagri TaxID=3034146 RepID=UPI0025A54B0A|nr:T9SS type A sorting domain-containing protein [Flavobacterium panacagri]